MGTSGSPALKVADYIKMYEYIFPQILKQEDPDRPYWPASPSSGGCFDDPQDPNRGDVHYWDVWHGMKPFTEYRKFHFRYASEFGFQSFPCLATVESFTEPEDRNIFSYVMEKHQRNAAANGKIMNYLSQTYLYPNQLRRLRVRLPAAAGGGHPLRRGALAAQPGPLHGRDHLAAERLLAGGLLGLHRLLRPLEGPALRGEALLRAGAALHRGGGRALPQNTNVNAEPFDLKKDRPAERLQRDDGALYRPRPVVPAPPGRLGERLGRDPGRGPGHVRHVAYGRHGLLPGGHLWRLLRLRAAGRSGREVSRGTVLFCPPKHFKFMDPANARREGDELVVTAKAYARSVEILAGADTVLSDNYFDMNAGERRVKILRGTPGDATARSVRHSLKEIPHNMGGSLAGEFQPSAACKFR